MTFREPPPQMRSRPGCLRGALGGVALLVLAPLVAAARSWRRWRRGSELRVEWRAGPFESRGGARLARLDLTVDVAGGRQAAIRELLTDVVVRVAELLSLPDDVCHQVYRLPELEETVVAPIGPRLQALGERFALALGQAALAGRTVIWLTLPRAAPPAQVLDPFRYDPESAGEPEGLLAAAPIRWAMATSYLTSGSSIVHRILLYVPRAAVPEVELLLERLRQ